MNACYGACMSGYFERRSLSSAKIGMDACHEECPRRVPGVLAIL